MDALAKLCPNCGRRYDSAALFCQKDGARLHLTEERFDPYIGQTLLDQFKIEEKIGAGGMGSVYRARQTTLHRDVAIKILHPELADNRDAVRRFKREARVCTALDHPNVVRVFLFGQLKDGSLYIVMEYLEGRSLLEVIRRDGALPVHRALHIATQICDGVGEAHTQGVVHRDIKPENVVLVTKQRDPDVAKVLDFGIARVLYGDDVTQATQSGLVFGTARYISPEGAAGEPTDARSDVYSLGILTYQLLSGVTPFDAPSPVAMLMKHIHADPPHLLSQSRAAHVPESVADVVMRALAKNPEGRYDDGYDLGEALRAAAESSGFEVFGRRAARPSIGPPSEPGVRRGPASAAAITPTPPMTRPAQVESPTLEGAPSPFGDGDDDELAIPGLGRPRRKGERSGLARTLGTAFLIGAVLVGGGFGIAAFVEQRPTREEVDIATLVEQARAALERGALDDPRATSVLGLTDRILGEHPDHPDAVSLRRIVRDRLVEQAEERAEEGEREEAIALYRRALTFGAGDAAIDEAIQALNEPEVPPPIPGIRTRPIHVVERHEVTLVAVLADHVDVGERDNPRFVIKRRNRQIGRSVAATLAEDGVSYEATHTIVRPGTYRLIFRIGAGRDRIEESAEIEVHRDPDRPRRPVDYEDDLPPITTQGSSWTPSVAPAWTPTVEPPVVGPQLTPVPQPDPPPPPAPWTGGGSVL